uniref:hypothetical protein n=1 Tax=Helicobacter pylori TaxID=210 RepID=UPI0037C19291
MHWVVIVAARWSVKARKIRAKKVSLSLALQLSWISLLFIDDVWIAVALGEDAGVLVSDLVHTPIK